VPRMTSYAKSLRKHYGQQTDNLSAFEAGKLNPQVVPGRKEFGKIENELVERDIACAIVTPFSSVV
jgi:hypothetical protein